MSLQNEIIECGRCSQRITSQSYQCSHCIVSFCYQCLIKHHHNDVKYEFVNIMHRIDEILATFLHHAHNQTEWTCHLTEDRNRLGNYIRHIENSYRQYPILALPSFSWLTHVHSLICKNSFSVSENCCKLMYPYSDSSIQSS